MPMETRLKIKNKKICKPTQTLALLSKRMGPNSDLPEPEIIEKGKFGVNHIV